MRTDPLAGLNPQQRRAREREDFEFIRQAAHVAPGTLGAAERGYRPIKLSADADTLAICYRWDLQHPRAHDDMVRTNCADCGCDLQFREHPEFPMPATPLCLCCAATRLRERGRDAD